MYRHQIRPSETHHARCRVRESVLKHSSCQFSESQKRKSRFWERVEKDISYDTDSVWWAQASVGSLEGGILTDNSWNRVLGDMLVSCQKLVHPPRWCFSHRFPIILLFSGFLSLHIAYQCLSFACLTAMSLLLPKLLTREPLSHEGEKSAKDLVFPTPSPST